MKTYVYYVCTRRTRTGIVWSSRHRTKRQQVDTHTTPLTRLQLCIASLLKFSLMYLCARDFDLANTLCRAHHHVFYVYIYIDGRPNQMAGHEETPRLQKRPGNFMKTYIGLTAARYTGVAAYTGLNTKHHLAARLPKQEQEGRAFLFGNELLMHGFDHFQMVSN